MFDRTLFRHAILSSLQCWPSFQVCIQNGEGGPNALEKVEWMADSIVQLFSDNATLIVEDVSNFLAEMIDNEFDTFILDGSLEMICSSIYSYHGQICSENSQLVMDQIEKLVNNYAAQHSASQKSPKAEAPMEMEDPENDGWTVVSKKKK